MAFKLPLIDKPILPHEALQRYQQDDAKDKANLTVGTYWNEQENLHAFEAVRQARSIVHSQEHCHNYPLQGGPEKFRRLVTELALGKNHPALPRSTSIQTLGSSGALTLAGRLLSLYLGCNTISLSSPYWPAYANIFKTAAIPEIITYRYLNNGAFDRDAMLEDLLTINNQSAVVIQLSCHNPTGCDPTEDDWHKIAAVLKQKKHRVILDASYHGFVSGNPHKDLVAARIFADGGLDFLLCQSFSKNLTMYADRIGCLTVVAESPKSLETIEAALFALVYHTYISPPRDGALIVAAILDNPNLTNLWLQELQEAADRLNKNRSQLHDQLQKHLPSTRWDRILKQKGLYCFIEISPAEVDELRERFSVYILRNGRINLSGLNPGNIQHVARSLAAISNEL